MTCTNRVESFKMTRTNRESFHVVQACALCYAYRPWSLGIKEHLLVEMSQIHVYLERNFLAHLTSLSQQIISTPCYQCSFRFSPLYLFTVHLAIVTRQASLPGAMTTPSVSVAITVSLQVSSEPVYTTVTSSSTPAENSQTPVTPTFVYITPTGRCVHRAACKHLKASTRAMHICSCVMQECGPSTRIYADDDDRLRVHSCPQAICRGKAYSKCRDCWITR